MLYWISYNELNKTIMKRFIILCSAIVAVLTINACEKLPDGTGTLKVEVSGFYYENNVRIYPYGLDD